MKFSVLQFMEETVAVVQVVVRIVPQERVQERIGEQLVEVPVSQARIVEQPVDIAGHGGNHRRFRSYHRNAFRNASRNRVW